MANPGDSSHPSATLVEQIKEIVGDSKALATLVHEYAQGDYILREGGSNQVLFIILDGTIDLIKGNPGVMVETLQPGALLGLLSYSTGNPVFTTAVAGSKASLFRLERADYEQLAEQHPALKRLLDSLTISDLAARYRRSVLLNAEKEQLTTQLKEERNNLQEAIARIEHTRTALISHEKMATLGQLVAGLAHELNNPASSLQHSVERLIGELPLFVASHGKEEIHRLVRTGIESQPLSGRRRIQELEMAYPTIGRSILRGFSALPEEEQRDLRPLLEQGRTDALREALQAHQIGLWIRSVRLSGQRIIGLVRSLKNYSRQDCDTFEAVDLRPGINDTLLILQNHLRKHQVDVHLAETPPVRCRPGSINQVWTNLIVNATEAMKAPGWLGIKSSYDAESNEVCVTISDTGPGIPTAIRDRIFDMNFTTKTGKSGFGLGLGLAISRDIIQDFGGHVEVEENDPHGSRFKIFLPAAADRLTA